MKQNIITTNSSGSKTDIARLFHGVKQDENIVLPNKRVVCENKLYISATLGKKGELVIIVSNVATYKAAENYYIRWKIESLFQCLKGRGCNFEDTHMTNITKIKKLTALLAIAFCWAHKIGEWRCKIIRAIKLQTHGRKEQSIFRYGLDLLQDAISGIGETVKLFVQLIKILEPPDRTFCKHYLAQHGEVK